MCSISVHVPYSIDITRLQHDTIHDNTTALPSVSVTAPGMSHGAKCTHSRIEANHKKDKLYCSKSTQALRWTDPPPPPHLEGTNGMSRQEPHCKQRLQAWPPSIITTASFAIASPRSPSFCFVLLSFNPFPSGKYVLSVLAPPKKMVSK